MEPAHAESDRYVFAGAQHERTFGNGSFPLPRRTIKLGSLWAYAACFAQTRQPMPATSGPL